MNEILYKGLSVVTDRKHCNLVLVGNSALKRNMRFDDYFQNVDMESGDEESDHLEEYHEAPEERDLKDLIPKV